MKSKKKVPKIRFKGFDEEWEEKKFGNCALIQRGGSPRPIEEYITNDTNGISWIKIGDVSVDSRYITSTKEKIKPEGEYKSRRVIKGDLILSNSMSFGRPYIVLIEGCIHDGWLLIRDQHNMFDLEYLLQMLSSEYMLLQYKSLASGGVVNNLNSELVQSTIIQIPNKKEQKQIGNFFQNIDKLIVKNQAKLDKLKNIKKACLEKMFPKKGSTVPEIRFKGFTGEWEEKELDEIINWSKGSNLTKAVLNEDSIGNAVIHYADLYKFQPVIDAVIHWSEKEEGTDIPLNSLLFPMSDVTPFGLARTSTITRQGVKASGDTLIGTIVKNHTAIFLSYQINANAKDILPLVTGTTVRHISASSLSTLNIKLTSLKEQTQIGSFFKNIDNLINKNQQQLSKLKSIKKACLEKMFVNKEDTI